jgi:hypothetical protein
MARLLVTVGTDGTKDWVQTPDGQKFSLGRHSVLSFVSKLARSSSVARHTLDTFLASAQAMFSVDDDKMWGLLTPRRARWASDGSFMSQDQRHPADSPQRDTTMDTLPQIIAATENIAAYCAKQAAAGKPIDPRAVQDMGRIASELRKQADQSDNSNFYGLGAPKVDRPEEGFANEESSPAGLVEMNKAAANLDSKKIHKALSMVHTLEKGMDSRPEAVAKAADKVGLNSQELDVLLNATNVKKNELPKKASLTFDAYEANLKVAEEVLEQSKETIAAIDRLASAGKKFNHTAARTDVAKVASRVASICEKTALTEEWVQADLEKLASESTRLRQLFPQG